MTYTLKRKQWTGQHLCICFKGHNFFCGELQIADLALARNFKKLNRFILCDADLELAINDDILFLRRPTGRICLHLEILCREGTARMSHVIDTACPLLVAL